MARLVFSVLAPAMALVATSARAQMHDSGYPVCMHVFGDLEGDRMDCFFASPALCTATASGRAAMCLVNPYFAPASGQRRHQK